MKEKFMQFIRGRYGIDSFGRCTIFIALITIILARFTRSGFLSLFSWACIIYTYFRMFSRNIYKRSAENQAYLAKTYKIRCFFLRQKNRLLDLRTHHIYRCPGCRQKIRVPRGKGRIEIRCPKCNTTFIKKS
ncbi:hypothetical protein [Faecalicatena contorta]|uniref:hypothetical protein n=1 Tax=Faecalicatena contorta TaxID=39482 RepID=UPI001F186F63